MRDERFEVTVTFDERAATSASRPFCDRPWLR
jgi:hypothetical protein